MAKPKIKLTDSEKCWFDNLLWYIENEMLWAGTADQRVLKEIVTGGKYAVFFSNGDNFGAFHCVVCAENRKSARAVEEYNRYPITRTVNLESLWVERELLRSTGPDFGNFVRKLQHDSDKLKYADLKKKFKSILKYFKR